MVSSEHVYIVFYVHINSSGVHGRHDVLGDSNLCSMSDILRLSLWSEDQIEVES